MHRLDNCQTFGFLPVPDLTEMQSNRISFGLNLILFFVTLYLTLSIPWKPSLWTVYADPYDYLHQSQISLFNREFFFPHKAPPSGRQPLNFFPRPFTVPLFYKLAGSNPNVIVQIQKSIHCVTAFFLAFSISLFIKRSVLQCLVTICIYLLMSWWNILGWSILLLSESLSISLMFCWTASFLLLLKRNNTVSLCLHILITILFAFTRDTWPYILVAFYSITLLSFSLLGNGIISKTIGVLALSIALYFVQHKAAVIGQRQLLPLINTIVVRIIPSAEYTRWFADRGLPSADRLTKEFHNLDLKTDPTAVSKIYNLYVDSTYADLFNWCNRDGEKTYVKFLVTHPHYTFLFTESAHQRRRIFATDTGFAYARNVRGYSQLAQHIFPLFNLTALIVLLVLLLLLYTKHRQQILLVPVYLAIVFAFNVLLSYNADALEVERHLFITGVMIQFLSIIALALILDNIGFPDKYNPVLRWMYAGRRAQHSIAANDDVGGEAAFGGEHSLVGCPCRF
jgi:hypothetical protein